MSGVADKGAIRDRIERAAEQIIRADGAKRLTMRRLAHEAGVALKTPYNLYGSRTGLLMAFLDRANNELLDEIAAAKMDSALVGSIATLDGLRAFYEKDEAFFRGIFWEIMASNHPEVRSDAHQRIIGLVVARMIEAYDAGELKPDVDPATLGGQMGLNLLANMGMWGGGELTIAQTVAHTKAIWLALLIPAAANAAAGELAPLLTQAQSALADGVQRVSL